MHSAKPLIVMIFILVKLPIDYTLGLMFTDKDSNLGNTLRMPCLIIYMQIIQNLLDLVYIIIGWGLLILLPLEISREGRIIIFGILMLPLSISIDTRL